MIDVSILEMYLPKCLKIIKCRFCDSRYRAKEAADELQTSSQRGEIYFELLVLSSLLLPVVQQ